MIRLAVRCTPDLAEIVLAELTVLAPGGVEEARGDGYVEYAIYGAQGELPDIGEVEAASGDGLVEVVATEVPDDWSERWRAFHRPVLVGGDERHGIWLRPPWEPASDGALEVVIDPGQAFGTGAHPTTRLCVEFLLDLARGGGAEGPLTDLGSGSGVLAIAAAKLGWGPVSGYDHEAAAVEASLENARVNGVEARFERLDLKRGLPGLAPLVVANLTAPLLEAVAAGMGADAAPRTLICSGLLEAERGRVAAAFAPLGLEPAEARAMDGWAGLRMVRA